MQYLMLSFVWGQVGRGGLWLMKVGSRRKKKDGGARSLVQQSRSQELQCPMQNFFVESSHSHENLLFTRMSGIDEVPSIVVITNSFQGSQFQTSQTQGQEGWRAIQQQCSVHHILLVMPQHSSFCDKVTLWSEVLVASVGSLLSIPIWGPSRCRDQFDPKGQSLVQVPGKLTFVCHAYGVAPPPEVAPLVGSDGTQSRIQWPPKNLHSCISIPMCFQYFSEIEITGTVI